MFYQDTSTRTPVQELNFEFELFHNRVDKPFEISHTNRKSIEEQYINFLESLKARSARQSVCVFFVANRFERIFSVGSFFVDAEEVFET